MSVILAGGAGFIGSRLAAHFLRQKQVLILDNFCRGRKEFFDGLEGQENLTVVQIDLADVAQTQKIVADFHKRYPVEVVWHMAANSDIPAGISDANVDLRNTFMTTFSLLEAMKEQRITRMAFASSSAIYGDFGQYTKLHENIGPLLPISNYGAMKLASEAIISAASEVWLDQVWIFRFPNVVGIPATHGVMLDFVRKLKANPSQLTVLGNGTQQKAYLHVNDLVDAMLFIEQNAHEKINIYNIGPNDEGCSVRYIAETAVARVQSDAKIRYGREPRGWVGDVPRFMYSVDKLAALGWKSPHSSQQAVVKAMDEIAKQEGL